MIQFTCEGKPCFANVYAYDTTPREYHVHIVNTHFFSSLPEHIVLIEQNEKLCLQDTDHIPVDLVNIIAESIEEHLAK